MRVKVAVTLDIDPAAWVELYDVHRDEVRNDVNEWAYELLVQGARANGVIPKGL